jgi:hypothetical protein
MEERGSVVNVTHLTIILLFSDNWRFKIKCIFYKIVTIENLATLDSAASSISILDLRFEKESNLSFPMVAEKFEQVRRGSVAWVGLPHPC